MTLFGEKIRSGWGVVREEPWDFLGLYETQLEATAVAIDLGVGYAAHYGEIEGGSRFTWKAGAASESTPPSGPHPSDSNKRNERDAGEADKRTIARIVLGPSGRKSSDPEPQSD